MYARIIILLFLFSNIVCAQNWGYKRFSTANGLMSNQVEALFLDKNGMLWIANGNGLTRYNGKDFVNYLNDSLLTPLVKVNDFSIRQLDDSTIFYSMKYGYAKTSNKRKNYIDIYLSDTLAIDGEDGVTNKKGILFFRKGYVDFDFNQFKVINHLFSSYPDNKEFPSNLLSSNEGNVFYSFFDKTTNTRNLYLFENNMFKKISDGIMFIISGIFENTNYYFILPDNWTSSQPIIVIDKINLMKTYLKKSPTVPDATLLGNALIYQNNLILPALNGVYLINERKEQIFIYDTKDKEWLNNLDKSKLYQSLFKSLHVYNNQWIVNGYRLINIERKKIQIPGIIFENIQKGNYVFEVIPDEEGNLWYATFNGLYQLFPLPYEPVYPITEDRIAEVNDSIENNRFKCMIEMDKIEYCLTNDSEHIQILIPEIKEKFFKYDITTKKISPIYVYGLQSPILKERLYPILSYKKLIVCQEYTRGLIFYHLNQTLDTAYYHLFNYATGLISNYVENVFVDKNENVWLITWDGIQMISYDDLLSENYERAKRYSESLKLDMIPFMQGSDIYFANGLMLFKIPTDKVVFNSKPPNIIIEEIFYKHNNKIYHLTFKQDSIYELPHNFEDISINFFGVCLSDGSQVKYKYIIDDVTHYQSDGNIVLSGLSYGRHSIEIYASNNFNIWNDEPVRLYIEILPPFWEKWWFKISIAVAIGIIIFTIIKKREYDLRQRKQELEELVRIRTKEIEEKNKLVEQKNTEILDSIYYTKRLQQSSLPSESEVKKIFPESFLLYLPKDIISGDFYFTGIVKTNEGKILHAICVGDCTGHGVPGAFMSILILAYIKQSLTERSVNSPADALEFISQKVQKVLEYKNQESEVKDSADMVFAVFDKDTNSLWCACANNPIYIIRNQNLIEIPAQKRCVGYSDNTEPFINHNVPLQKGDVVYLFTDGYADQFGISKETNQEKKFTKKRLKDTLIRVSQLDITKQKDELIRIYQEWKSHCEQTDDICIIGIKV